jgi:flagellar basal body-associated protein FliL
MPGSEQGETMMDRMEIRNIMLLRIVFLFLLGTVLLAWGWINQLHRFKRAPENIPSR